MVIAERLPRAFRLATAKKIRLAPRPSPIFPARMKSMTGYGRGECARDGFKVTVELSSVNRRQSEIVVYLPRELEALEPRVRDESHRRSVGGHVAVEAG